METDFGFSSMFDSVLHLAVNDDYGMWMTHTGKYTYYRNGITSSNLKGTGWTHILGAVESISTGRRGVVLAHNYHGHVYYISGISASAPAGTKWTQTYGHGVRSESCGFAVCFIVNIGNQVFSTGLLPGTDSPGMPRPWTLISSNVMKVSAYGEKTLWKLDAGGNSWEAVHILDANFYTMKWERRGYQQTKFKDIAVTDKKAYALSTNGLVYVHTGCPIFDFEDGDISGWKQNGTAFNNQPILGQDTAGRNIGSRAGDWMIYTLYKHTNNNNPRDGITFVGEGPTGTLTSPLFQIRTNMLHFAIGGGSYPLNYAALMVDNLEIKTSHGHSEYKITNSGSVLLGRFWWDTTNYVSKCAKIMLHDSSSDSWGFTMFDDLRESPPCSKAMKAVWKSKNNVVTVDIGQKVVETISVKGFSSTKLRKLTITVDIPFDDGKPLMYIEEMKVVRMHCPSSHTENSPLLPTNLYLHKAIMEITDLFSDAEVDIVWRAHEGNVLHSGKKMQLSMLNMTVAYADEFVKSMKKEVTLRSTGNESAYLGVNAIILKNRTYSIGEILKVNVAIKHLDPPTVSKVRAYNVILKLYLPPQVTFSAVHGLKTNVGDNWRVVSSSDDGGSNHVMHIPELLLAETRSIIMDLNIVGSEKLNRRTAKQPIQEAVFLDAIYCIRKGCRNFQNTDGQTVWLLKNKAMSFSYTYPVVNNSVSSPFTLIADDTSSLVFICGPYKSLQKKTRPNCYFKNSTLEWRHLGLMLSNITYYDAVNGEVYGSYHTGPFMKLYGESFSEKLMLSQEQWNSVVAKSNMFRQPITTAGLNNAAENKTTTSVNGNKMSIDLDGLSSMVANAIQWAKQIVENPFQYDNHLELIKELRLLGDLEKLRKARETMAELFPLTEELWIEWFTDELPLAVVPDHKEYILSLFEKAIKDYTSVRIWLQYCQFVLDGIQSSTGLEDVRDIYERAITSVGLHLTEGCSLWDSYREFEMALLESLQAGNQDTDVQKIEAQMNKVEALYRRQLAVPLLGMEATFDEYEDWTSEPIPESTEKAYERACAKLEQCLQFENKLSTAALPKLVEYQEYISFEMKDGDPARIQCVFERAIKDNCLQSDLWQQYTQYLDHKLKVPSIALKVHERAVRNCPWISTLWDDYLKAMDQNKCSYSEVKEVFQKAIASGFSSGEEYLQLWLTYCDSMKGRVESWESADEIEALRKAFEEAATYMEHYFGADGDKSSLLRRYWAAIEAKYLGNLKKAQELWDAVMKIHGKDTHMWLEYTHFLRLHGDVLACRRAFQRAVQTTVDDPRRLCEAFVNFERIEGNFTQLESAIERSKNQIARIDRKHLKEAELEADRLKGNLQREEKRKQAKLEKNRTNKKLGKLQKTKEARTNKRFHKDDGNADHQRKDRKEASRSSEPKAQGTASQQEQTATDEPAPKRARIEGDVDKDIESQQTSLGADEDTHEDKRVHNEANMKQTVFLSNLLFSIDEQAIKAKFQDVGEINEVRIVRNLVGRSKGFAYLEFKEEMSVKNALLKDRELLDGRPMFVSPCLDKSKNQHQAFRYKTSLDKHTVFVTNLPFEARKEEVMEVFKTAGEIKEVRMVTNRAGKPKGYAYIEFNKEASATSAVLNLDKHIMNNREINVALSKPPARNQKDKSEQRMEPPRHQPLPHGSRGRAKTQLAMVPRSVHKQPLSKGIQQNMEQNESEKDAPEKKASEQLQRKMSNADFSKLFSK
eukprot:gene14299-15787_t